MLRKYEHFNYSVTNGQFLFLFCLLKYLGHNFTNVYIAMDLYLQLNLWMHNLFVFNVYRINWFRFFFFIFVIEKSMFLIEIMSSTRILTLFPFKFYTQKFFFYLFQCFYY